MKIVRFVLIGMFAFSVFMLSNRSSAEASTPIEVGYSDFQFPSNLGNKEVTAEKPESKLWWNDGFWWASMWSSSGNAYHIFKLDWSTQDWVDTGTALDDRSDSRADALWDGSKLYVVSHIWSGDGSAASAGQRGELYRYSYSSGTKSYSLDSGYPVEVNGGNSEALVIDKDSTGILWVTYVQDSKVYVNHSVLGDDSSWETPQVLPSNANVDSDDLSSIVAYDGHIGVMWSSQTSGNKMYFAARADDITTLDDYTVDTWKTTGAYTTSGDDHINLKSLSTDGAGSVFAAVKTSQSAALLLVMVCKGDCASASSWSIHTAYTGSDGGSPTRPALLLDTSNRDLYLFARVKDGTNQNIFYKRSDMDNISFPSGPGEPFIESATYTGINDPTTTKQNVNNTTGIVVMASDSQARYYFHNCIRLAGGTSSQCLTGNPTPEVRFSQTSYQASEDGAPLAEVTVELTGSVGGAVTVDYAVTAGTATSGLDYTPTANGQLTFAAGSTTPQKITVQILEDSLPEIPETINVTLSNLTGTGVSLSAEDTATLTILDDDVPPTINFGSATYNVIENGVQATIDVTLSNSSDAAVSVQYATANGTAVAGQDYVAIPPTTLTFNPGDPLSKSFTVTLINNPAEETVETVLLNLSNPSLNASLGAQNTATLSIFDDDAPLDVAFESATYNVIENEGMATINVMLSRPFGTPVSVYYQTIAGGTATAGSDYTAIAPTQLVFNPGEFNKSFVVPIIDNDIEELPETVRLSLSSPSANAKLGAQKTATLNIADNDVAPGITFSSATYNVNESGSAALITVQLSHSFDSTVTVNYQTANGSANAGSDYTPILPTMMTFTPGQMSKSFNVLINNDGAPEPSETVQLILSSPSANAYLGTPSTATLTILDDDTMPTITVESATYDADENGGDVAVAIILDTVAGQTVKVTYATSDDTAEAGTDYEAASNMLVFAPGETRKTIFVTVIDDSFEEGNETFNLALSAAENGEIGTPDSTTITIVDDELPPSVTFTETSYTVLENQERLTITAQLSRPVNQEVMVNYSTTDGTAMAGEDYKTVSGQLIFPPYQTSKSFTVYIVNDSENEQDETINLRLSGATTTPLGMVANATVTIRDDDRPTAQFSKSAFNTYGIGAAQIEVLLNAPAAATATVRFATSDGTAVAGSDYSAVEGILIFEPGSTSQTFTVPILAGNPNPTEKTINIILSSSLKADLGLPDTAVLKILKNEPLFLPIVKG